MEITTKHIPIEMYNALMNMLPKSRNKDYLKSANLILNDNKYLIPPFGTIHYLEGIQWKEDKSRSYLRLLHALTPLGCLTDSFLDSKETKYVKKGLEIIKDWKSTHEFSKDKNTMAYHDETTALRLQYLLRFYIISQEALNPEDKIMLEEEMFSTNHLLAQEHFHSTNTNHGMFQDIALLLYSCYFNQKQYIQVALERLLDYFNHVYTTEGVHKEHSPAYHLVVSNNLKKLIKFIATFNTIISEKLKEIFVKTEEFATYIIRPDGVLPPIGDTEEKKFSKSGFKNLYSSEHFKFASSLGEEGEPPMITDRVFKESGYAIFRDDWSKKENSSYVLFNAAYHVDYHKHSDDLSVYIYSDGEDIITEAGPNGYNYKDSFTQYAYSSFAHNTLIVDGEGLLRTDGQYEKLYIEDYIIGEETSEATGVNERFSDVIHKRNVKFNKSDQQVVVTDNIISDNKHNYKLLWHVAEEIDVHLRDTVIELFRRDKKIMEIEFHCKSSFKITEVKGQSFPSVQGWKFPRMEQKAPSSVIEVEFTDSNTIFKTEFRLANFKVNTKKPPFELETVFSSVHNVRYHFQEATDDKLKDQLIIVFSSLAEKYQYKYNYIRTLENIPANKLYILDDFGDQGAYYLGNDRDFAIETTVNSLIQFIMRKYDIVHKNLTAVGSSKGGYAALYFGIKNYVGNIIAGAPQSRLGHFLINQAKHHNISDYISGGSTKADQVFLDQLLFSVLQQPSESGPKISIMVGDKDHHYENHVQPLANALKTNGFGVDVEVEKGLDHNGLKTHFPKYLTNKILEVLDYEIEVPEILSVDMVRENASTLKISCCSSGMNLEYAFYIYKDDELIEKIMYSTSHEIGYKITDNGKYMSRVFVRDKTGSRDTKYTKSITIDI
ncbi:MAG: heparinase II/III domain-containing protein [Bacillota bacterium]